MIDVTAVLKAWRPGEWQGRCGVSPVHLTFGVWWSEDGAHVGATLGEDGRWKADFQLDGEHSASGYGDTIAEAVLSMIEQEAFSRGEAAERAKGGA